jgi:cold shock CspA family protein
MSADMVNPDDDGGGGFARSSLERRERQPNPKHRSAPPASAGDYQWGFVLQVLPRYGFVSGPTRQQHLFLPTDVLDAAGYSALRPGDRVSFTSVPGRPGKGPRALRVQSALHRTDDGGSQ